MDGRKALEVDVDFRAAPEVPRAGIGATAALPVWLAVVAGLLGPVLAEVRTLLEPAPAHADEALPVIAVVIGVVELAAWVGAAWMALQRRPLALGFAAVAAAAAVIGVVACPTTGHHSTTAGWWYAELGISLAALAGMVAALRWWAGRSSGARTT